MGRQVERWEASGKEQIHGGDSWRLGDKTFSSRFFAPVAFQNLNVCIRALDTNIARSVVIESGTQFLIVSPPSALIAADHPAIDQLPDLDILEQTLRKQGKDFAVLNNTARSLDAEQAVSRAREGISFTRSPYIKLEVFETKTVENGAVTLVPNDREVLVATKNLLADRKLNSPEQLVVIPFITADKGLADELVDIGARGIRVYGGYIGLGRGLNDKRRLEEFITYMKTHHAEIPIIAEGGIGQPAHAREAMLLGADAVLVNNAITTAPPDHAVVFAGHFKNAIIGGRAEYLQGIRGNKTV